MPEFTLCAFVCFVSFVLALFACLARAEKCQGFLQSFSLGNRHLYLDALVSAENLFMIFYVLFWFGIIGFVLYCIALLCVVLFCLFCTKQRIANRELNVLEIQVDDILSVTWKLGCRVAGAEVQTMSLAHNTRAAAFFFSVLCPAQQRRGVCLQCVHERTPIHEAV